MLNETCKWKRHKHAYMQNGCLEFAKKKYWTVFYLIKATDGCQRWCVPDQTFWQSKTNNFRCHILFEYWFESWSIEIFSEKEKINKNQSHTQIAIVIIDFDWHSVQSHTDCYSNLSKDETNKFSIQPTSSSIELIELAEVMLSAMCLTRKKYWLMRISPNEASKSFLNLCCTGLSKTMQMYIDIMRKCLCDYYFWGVWGWRDRHMPHTISISLEDMQNLRYRTWTKRKTYHDCECERRFDSVTRIVHRFRCHCSKLHPW